MSKLDTLFGAALGAALVGTTLIVQDALTNPETGPAVRERVRRSAEAVGRKAGEVCRTVGRRASELGREAYAKVEGSEAVRRIRHAGERIFRRKPEAEAEDELAADIFDEDAEHPVADGSEPQEAVDPLASEEDGHFPVS